MPRRSYRDRGAFPDDGEEGLTKLEYAAIHIAAGLAVTMQEYETEEEDYNAQEHVALVALTIARELFHAEGH
jgi:hypothetical protein